jgi:ATP-binding cassette subfamily F protein 3
MRGDVLGLVGPNGAGKTTLIRALFGERPVAGGDLRLGASIDAGWYRQDMSQVPLGTTIYGAIEELRPTWTRGLIQGHLGRFGFSGDEVQRRVETLSGGERARVALAMLMLSHANLLVLDEPTNHLDVESIEALEDALEGYEGTVLLVSHDRELLRALTTKVWALHERRITEFHGGFAEWEEARAGRARDEAARATEEAALQKARSRKRAATVRDRDARTDPRRARRAAEREAAEAEAEVGRLESEVATLTSALDDPDLYAQADGVAEATRLGAELRASRKRLDAAIERWTSATEHAESVATEAAPEA